MAQFIIISFLGHALLILGLIVARSPYEGDVEENSEPLQAINQISELQEDFIVLDAEALEETRSAPVSEEQDEVEPKVLVIYYDEEPQNLETLPHSSHVREKSLIEVVPLDPDVDSEKEVQEPNLVVQDAEPLVDIYRQVAAIPMPPVKPIGHLQRVKQVASKKQNPVVKEKQAPKPKKSSSPPPRSLPKSRPKAPDNSRDSLDGLIRELLSSSASNVPVSSTTSQTAFRATRKKNAVTQNIKETQNMVFARPQDRVVIEQPRHSFGQRKPSSAITPASTNQGFRARIKNHAPALDEIGHFLNENNF